MQSKAEPSDKSGSKEIEIEKPRVPRERTSNLRDQYFLERELIRREIGDLDQIRARLGLSQRRLCQLLLVDPSAWTRWLKLGAPPHIYQALRWLLKLNQTNPEVMGPRDLASRVDQIHLDTHTKIKSLEEHITLLERELALRNTTVHSPDLEITQMALRAQEQRFQSEIARLEERLPRDIAQKVLKKPGPKKKAAVKKKHESISKTLLNRKFKRPPKRYKKPIKLRKPSFRKIARKK